MQGHDVAKQSQIPRIALKSMHEYDNVFGLQLLNGGQMRGQKGFGLLAKKKKKKWN
jgi:hypothetical protein